MNCAVCQESTTVLVFKVDEESGARKTVPYCEVHLPRKDALASRMEEILDDSISKIKRVISFAAEHARFPNSAEIRQMGEVGEFPCDPNDNIEFREKLMFLDQLVSFAESERRFPNRRELPDPFESEGYLSSL